MTGIGFCKNIGLGEYRNERQGEDVYQARAAKTAPRRRGLEDGRRTAASRGAKLNLLRGMKSSPHRRDRAAALI
jgi:hypothetical protein